MKNRHWKQAAEAHGGKLASAVQRSHDAVKAGKNEKERLTNFVNEFADQAKRMVAAGATVADFEAALLHTTSNIAVIKDGIKHGIDD